MRKIYTGLAAKSPSFWKPRPGKISIIGYKSSGPTEAGNHKTIDQTIRVAGLQGMQIQDNTDQMQRLYKTIVRGVQ